MKWFARARGMGSTGAAVLLVAALVVGATALVVGANEFRHHDHDHDHDHGSTKGFTISSRIYSIYASSGCSGTSPALLYPGTTRCAVFNVHNNLNVPITVTSISAALSDVGLPGVCVGVNLTIPVFSGALTVPAEGDANTLGVTGVPVSLNESHTNQDACQDLTYHFRYWGTAQYTDKSTTLLASAPNPSTPGHSVSFTATIANGSPGSDQSNPSGTVTFYRCTSVTGPCTISLGSAPIADGRATFSTSTLVVGPSYVEAVYGGSGTDLLGSTSNIVTQTVTSGSGHCDDSHPDHGTGQNHDLHGTQGNDSIHVGDGNNSIDGGDGDDCIEAGDGNNTIHDGNGNDWISVGHGSNMIWLGNGDSTITLLGGSHSAITVGNGDNTAFLGAGTYNTFTGGKGKNTCHLPSSAASLHDTITRCTVVIP